jgi:hypothetical protein
VRPQEHLPAIKAATASRRQWQKPGPLLLPFFQDSELPQVYSIDALTNTSRYVLYLHDLLPVSICLPRLLILCNLDFSLRALFNNAFVTLCKPFKRPPMAAVQTANTITLFHGREDDSVPDF